MSLLSFALWLQDTDFFTGLRLSFYVYPIVLTGHLAGIIVFGGTVLVTDLRLLGLALRKYPVADVAGQLRGLKCAGLLLVAPCGLLLLGSKAEEYYYNVFFHWKLVFFALVALHGLVFHGSVYGKLDDIDRSGRVPPRAKAAAWLSLALWTGLIVIGRGIGFVEPPASLHAYHSFLPAPSAVPVFELQ